MPRQVYSALLASATAVPDTPTSLGGPPDGTLWVARFISATFGFYLGYIGMAVSIGGVDPWLWITQTGPGNYFTTHQFSIYWEGRFVIPAGAELYAKASDADSGDILVSGYQLTVGD